jgi:hypothetical protein
MTPDEAAKRAGEIAEWFDRLHEEHPLDGRDADAETLRVLLAEREQYGLLKAAVNAEACDDPEHGPDCACSFHRMLEAAEQRAETAEALLREVMRAGHKPGCDGEDSDSCACGFKQAGGYAVLEAKLREVEAERDALREALAGAEQLATTARWAYDKLTSIEQYGEHRDNPLPALLRGALAAWDESRAALEGGDRGGSS